MAAYVSPRGDDPETYLKIVFVLVPIYAVVIIGWAAGAHGGAAACSIVHPVDQVWCLRMRAFSRPPWSG
jgi:hypothetical protein